MTAAVLFVHSAMPSFPTATIPSEGGTNGSVTRPAAGDKTCRLSHRGYLSTAGVWLPDSGARPRQNPQRRRALPGRLSASGARSAAGFARLEKRISPGAKCVRRSQCHLRAGRPETHARLRSIARQGFFFPGGYVVDPDNGGPPGEGGNLRQHLVTLV